MSDPIAQLSSKERREFELWARSHQVKQVIGLFKTLSSSCFNQCILTDFTNTSSTSNNGQLTERESRCVDDCVGRYLQANERLSVKLSQAREW